MAKRSRAKRSRTKRTKRSRTKRTIKKRHTGGFLPLSVTYTTTLVNNGDDLTGKPELYTKMPLIKINPADGASYFITLTDPDVPGHKTWTHYVATITADGKVIHDFYPYEPPSPPPNSGTHHYVFNVYKDKMTYTNIKKKEGMNGDNYYKQVLEPIIKNNKPFATLYYIIKATPNH
jgi:phosphatidylethanolamine-binding protein (PEBP) family uncharacterized protein